MHLELPPRRLGTLPTGSRRLPERQPHNSADEKKNYHRYGDGQAMTNPGIVLSSLGLPCRPTLREAGRVVVRGARSAGWMPINSSESCHHASFLTSLATRGHADRAAGLNTSACRVFYFMQDLPNRPDWPAPLAQCQCNEAQYESRSFEADHTRIAAG